ncbi:uncharacterized protein LOC141628654 [Silene latifolia]|uniref:uncharacterized protein LOC141628654 n=1 Tax=Silene latifolia TaxID=37657 RepID=UPI003D7752DE
MTSVPLGSTPHQNPLEFGPGSNIHNQETTDRRSLDSGNLTNKQSLELREMLSRVPGMPPPLEKAVPDSYADSPFVDAISIVAMPKGFANPNMTLFDGTTDPFDHVSQYKQKMMTVTAVGSIFTFADLVNAFTQQFASSRKPQKHDGDLYRIVQGVNETIEEFNTRFNNEKVAVRECDVSTAVEAFRRGLHHESDLYKQLTMHPCHSFEAVQEMAAAAIRLEEDILARASIPKTPSVSITSAMEKSSRKQSTGKKEEIYRPYSRGVNKEENQQLPTLAEYGFTTGVRGILKALTEMRDGVRWPRPPAEGQSWRKDSKKKSKRRATETKGDRPETSCRVSHNNLPAFAFDEEDIHDSQEHHDALIITLSMANCTVRKVLVYTGSSVNLLMLKTIKNMGFSEKDLQKKTIPLVGFSGETANSLGEIVIPTYAGGINKQVRYLVINGPSTYNIILGIPWLHLMKALPSTYHQCVKFSTPYGVETIREDKKEARGCYKKALKCTANPPA